MRAMHGSPGPGCAGPRAGYDAAVDVHEAELASISWPVKPRIV
jgi:hypothetical protein